MRPWRSRWAKAVVRSGSDNAYGIYLSQMLVITALVRLGWGRLSSTVPWPLLCLLSLVIVFGCCTALTSLLARTPLAVPLTGRRRQPWSTLIPRRSLPGLSASGPVPDPAPATVAGVTSDHSGVR